MQLDYELLKHILRKVRDDSDGFNPTSLVPTTGDAPDVFRKSAYHYKVLIDNNFVEGRIREECAGAVYPAEIVTKSLTLTGHKLLEAMENDTIWNKLKANITKMGIDGLKKIPALAIDLLITLAKS